jgi:hypothetical protein
MGPPDAVGTVVVVLLQAESKIGTRTSNRRLAPGSDRLAAGVAGLVESIPM